MHFWIEGVYLLGLPRVGMHGKEAPSHGDHDGEGSNEQIARGFKLFKSCYLSSSMDKMRRTAFDS